MIRDGAAVGRSLDRWEAAGLLDGATAERLRGELEEHAERERTRFIRLLLAATGAVVLVIAAGTFTAWIWPTLGVAARCAFLGVLGAALVAGGARMERGPRREPAWLLQAAGLVLIVIACAYSAERWPNGSPGGMVAGAIALLTPVLAFWYYVRRSDVMPVVTLLLGFVFIAIALTRAFSEGSGDTLIWVLDGVFVVEAALILLLLRAASPPTWAAGAAATLLYLMPVMIFFTTVGPLSGSPSDAAWPLDAWLIGTTALLLWLRGRPGLEWLRPRVSAGLVVSVLVGIGLAFLTTRGPLDAAPEIAALAVALVGVLALWFAVPRAERAVLAAGALALVVAAWYYAVERGEALSAFLALGFSAGVLFWVSTRVGRKGAPAA